MLVVVITAFSCKLKADRIGSFQFVICGLCSQHGQQALCSFYISRFHISWFIIGGLYFKRGIKKQSSPNYHDNYVSWSHFENKYITYYLRPGNPLKSCPKEVI